MSRNNIAELLERYQRGQCTPEEKARVDAWFEAHGMPETSFEQMSADEQENWTTALFDDIQGAKAPKVKTIYRKLYPYIAAASVILIIGSGILFLKSKPSPQQANDIPPGPSMAVLKTGHGKTFILNQVKNGLLTHTITKMADDRLAYAQSEAKESESVYDTLSIPAGARPYHLTLADGSKVLLNVATVFRFPESFAGNKRANIELISGEAFFDIIHNAKAPLQIKTPNELIEDIGTQFNVSAYPDDEDSRTTLAEGAIKVKAGTMTLQPKPGEQTVYANHQLTVSPANLTKVLAWTNG